MNPDFKMNKIQIYLLGVLLWIFVLPTTGQQANAVLDSTQIVLGDQVPLSLHFSAPKDIQVLWPYRQDTLTGTIEIIKQSELDSLIKEDQQMISQELTITSFDTGYMAIPPFQFLVSDGESIDTIETEPLLLYVRGISVDTTQPFKAIKGPMDAPLTFWDLLPWILAVIGVLLLVFVIWYIIWRKSQKKPILPVKRKPRDPADVEAIKALEQLTEQKLWQNGMIKAHYTELTLIVRIYIERVFEVPAAECTTAEIMQSLKALKKLDKKLMEELQEMFELADLVKFAKMEPLPSENESSMKRTYRFVEDTKEIMTTPEGGDHVE